MTKTIEELTAPITGWWFTSDEEHYEGGPLATREEARLAGIPTDAYAMARCTQKAIRVSEVFDAERWLEIAEEDNSEWQAEDGEPVLDFSADQIADLQACVRAAIDAWQVRHQLAPMPYLFASVDDIEVLPGREE